MLSRYVRFVVFVSAYLWVAQVVFFAAIQRPGNDYARADLPSLVDGSGCKPFVFRTLLPSAVRIAVLLTPESWRQGIENSLADNALFKTTPARDENYVYIYVIAYLLEGLALFAWLFVLRHGLIHFYRDHGLLTDLIPLLGAMAVPCLFRYVHYDYDFPQLLVFTSGLLLLAKQKWIWFYPVLLLCALSKETAVLLPLICFLTWPRGSSSRQLILHVLAQLAIVLGIRAWFQFIVFADNPGLAAENWWQRNLEFLQSPDMVWRMFFWFAPVGSYHVILPTTWNVLFLTGIPLLAWRWSSKPLFLRRAVWIAPLLLILMVRWGQVDEIRIFYELVPILFWLAAHTLLHAVSVKTGGLEAPTLPD